MTVKECLIADQLVGNQKIETSVYSQQGQDFSRYKGFWLIRSPVQGISTLALLDTGAAVNDDKEATMKSYRPPSHEKVVKMIPTGLRPPWEQPKHNLESVQENIIIKS